MSNGIVPVSRPHSAAAPGHLTAARRNSGLDKARAFVLAALMVATGGCAIAAAPLPEHLVVITTAAAPPAVRYRIDPARNRMWMLSDDGVFLYDIQMAGMPRKFKLPAWQVVDAPYSCLPDLALGPKGEAVVTSNIVPTLWKIDPESLAVSVHEIVLDADHDKDVGFSGLTYSPEHRAYFAVSDPHGSLWRIDPFLSTGQKIQLAAPVRKACGITGARAGD